MPTPPRGRQRARGCQGGRCARGLQQHRLLRGTRDAGGATVSIRVADIVDAVHDAFPPEWAESWDRVGLVAGDPDAPVSRVWSPLTPTLEALERARHHGAQVLVTHHPPFLEPVQSLTPAVLECPSLRFARGSRSSPRTRISTGRRPGLPHCRESARPGPGLRSKTHVSRCPWSPCSCPSLTKRAVAEAMAAAGAGRIGEYTGCSIRWRRDGDVHPVRARITQRGNGREHQLGR
jgi:hypothetical protein